MKGHILILCLLIGISLSLKVFGSSDGRDAGAEVAIAAAPTVFISPLTPDTVSAFESHLQEMPEPCVDMKVNYLGRNYRLVFNDSNYVHHQEAEKVGINPLTDLWSHWNNTRPLAKVVSCKDFYVEPLNYSRPFLVESAKAMLHEIGRRFNDSVAARGGGAYRLKVTSVLRTPESIGRLRRRNVNAVDSSVHAFGTTIDISHSSFICDNDSLPRSVNDLKGVLSEVLYAMREEGKCKIKFEYKQPCFHITVCDHPAYRK